ncbi:putative golgin subfamily A member 2-like protein 5 [Trypoxylus dichotomus]
MADATKAQRLLAAKKKVKEYQKNKKSKIDTNVDNKTPAESLTNSTHSSLNEVQHLDENETSNQVIHSVSPLQQYFTGGNSSIFDEIGSKNNANEHFYKFDIINYNGSDNSNKIVETQTKNACDSAIPYVEPNIITQEIPDVVAIEDPEIKPNEIFDRLNSKTTSDILNQDIEQKTVVSPYICSVDNNSSNTPVTLSSQICSNDNVNNVQENMQSLKQLSTQIIQLIDDNSVSTRVGLEIEKKNDKVYEYLELEQQKYKKLWDEMCICKARVEELEDESHMLKKNDEKQKQELKQLQDQVQCHQQTVNFLVAEKSELLSLLSENETTAKQKTSECNELSARLKTSRSRVADLEKELNSLRAERQDKRHLEQNEEHQKLIKEYEMLRVRNEETLQDVSELREKLNDSSNENLKLRQEVQDLTSQLSLLNIKLQQLSSGVDHHQFNGHIEGLTQQINMFEKQVIDLNNVIKTLSIEKEQTSVQYQQYVQQLNGQLNTLVQKLEEKTQENEALVAREQQLTSQMGEFEKLLQKMQNDQQVSGTKNGDDSMKELEKTQAALKSVEDEKTLLEDNYQLVISERDDAFKELELRKEEITQLEEEVNRLQSNQPDNAKLLATIESDKVAASRAVAQNAELKKQLEEIQQAFIQISNNKLELTELLNDQKHQNKELNEKLNQFEYQVSTLTEAIEIKDREMVALRESAQEVNRYMMQRNQLEDRLRHYEVQDHSTHALQHELQESYKKIQNLRSENETLKFHLKCAESKNQELQTAKTNAENNDMGIGKSERINEEVEVKSTEVQTTTNIEAIIQPQIIENSSESQKKNSQVIEANSESYLSQQIAMKQLEEKFTKTMQEIADLEDEKQRLEHLVLQLQDETETIGEYVTLYQHQRGVLKQRALERDEQVW